MDGKNQPKTKAELLQELQSIQSLLDDQDDEQFPALEDDDIPLLDEFLLEDNDADQGSESVETPSLEDPADEKLEADTLDALNAAYAALTDELGGESVPDETSSAPLHEDSEHETPSQSPTQPAPAAATPASRGNAPQDTAQADPQTAAQMPDAEQRADESTHSIEPGTGHGESPANRLTSVHTDPAAPAPLPGQQSLFDAPKSAPEREAGTKSRSERAPLPQKARGENPFLPQHIRERLKGNQVLPRAEFLQPVTPPAHQDLPPMAEEKPAEPTVAEQPESPTNDVELLVDQLVAEIMPTLEARLREIIAERLSRDPHED